MGSSANKQERLTIPSRDQMFSALARRDASWDGVFYYGVVTTGVFCRPSCAARPARRENVRFFMTPEEAEAAGFRPCKRCKPGKLVAENEGLVAIARFIAANADEKLTLATLSRHAAMSPARFQKSFKAAFGVSPKQFQDAVRLKRYKGALRDGDDVTGAIFAAGFGSTSRVYGEAARSVGMTPAVYRAGGEGECIDFAYRDSVLGPLLMAATDRGVCFAQFGDSREELEAQLREEFPKATFRESQATNSADLDVWIRALDEHLAGSAPRPDLPLDLRGTAFQLRVWRFLLSVQEGDVVSYGELAESIDKPGAVRAAASACGANRVGVLVPCHRVLRGNGELGGYRWGAGRKRTLLDVERRRKANAR
jgi:AraC family transcriptional regulator of adaptative response/methylated-DNA-[protein]-cysteine methyltransferase